MFAPPLALEARMLFDGSVGAEGMADTPEDTESRASRVPAAIDSLPRDTDRLLVEAPATAASVAAARPLVVIDPSVDQWEDLVAGLPAEARVILLDPASNGVQQIARAMLDAAAPVSSLHLVSHGSAGRLTLGDSVLNEASLGAYAAQWSAIGDQLAPGGDILIYGCDVAQGREGADFLAAVARATRADVAASSDDTGAAALAAIGISRCRSAISRPR
ncbi:MAG: DUF4347 domain-containing protein [Burkholderiaceae bacterium]